MKLYENEIGSMAVIILFFFLIGIGVLIIIIAATGGHFAAPIFNAFGYAGGVSNARYASMAFLQTSIESYLGWVLLISGIIGAGVAAMTDKNQGL